MRKLITFVMTILVSISFSYAQNLAMNPGFEDEASTFTVPYSATGGTTLTNWLRRVGNIQDATSLTTQPTSAAVAIGPGIWVKKATNTSYQRAFLSTSFYSGAIGLNLRIQSNLASTGFDLWTKTMVLQRLNTLSNTTKYTVSFWAKVDPTTDNQCTYLVPFMTDGTNKTNLSCAVLLTGGTEWAQYSATFDVPSFTAVNTDADFTTAYFGVGIATTYTSTNKTRYSGVILDDFSLTTTTEGTVTVTTSATTGGTVTGNGAVYVSGTNATVVATLTNNDYSFAYWSEDGIPVSTDPIYTFTANSNRNLVANFQSLLTSTPKNPEKEHVSIYVNEQNEIVIDAREDSNYAIYTTVGQQISTGKLNKNSELTTTNPQGVYIVKVGEVTKKVIVR